MEQLFERLDDIELKLTGIEIKLDALLYALEGEEDEPGGDQYGAERNSFNTLSWLITNISIFTAHTNGRKYAMLTLLSIQHA